MNWRLRHPLTIRGKMTLAALVPLATILLLVWGAALYLINAWIVGETQEKVRRDLNAAQAVLQHEEDRVADVIRFTAHSTAVTEALSAGAPQRLADELQAILQRERLDLLTLTGPQGQVLLRGLQPQGGTQTAAPAPVLRRIAGAEALCGPALFSAEELQREAEELARRARVRLLTATPERAPVEDRGMLLVCVTPVTGAGGEPLGYLYGGVLLNDNLPLVDQIRDLVFGAGTYRGTEIGSATLFLGDLRIATTVRLKSGERAIGTLVSAEVARAVLQERQFWLARAKVVDDWYITAYQPILGQDEQAIGALYVGQLEAPFSDLKKQAAFALFLLLLLGGALGYLLARRFSARLSRPILDLEKGARRVAEGERSLVLPIAARDEVGRLTEAFNRMTGALRQQETELQSLNRDLERKVAERTLLLEKKSRQLIRAQEDLARAERLAAIGSLAAGVAHEINNPAAIIRGNVEILLAGQPPEHPEREEAEEILKQTERLSRITASLLTFAREQSVRRETVQVNRLLEEVIAQIGHQRSPGQVEIRRRLDPELPPLQADGERLRQVFNNLILNALQALAGEGRLEIESALQGEAVEVKVADTGPGIAPEVREKIFHPFFTTRSDGTGLGLSVSYGIVQALGGTIEVASEPGQGSTFTVRLPVRLADDPRENDAGDPGRKNRLRHSREDL